MRCECMYYEIGFKLGFQSLDLIGRKNTNDRAPSVN